MTIQTETTTYRLNGETIDRIAEQVESFLTALGTERANIVRIRLSMEEVLLRWLDRFGTGAEVRFSTNINWTRPEIVLALRGEICNPLNMTESELDTWSNSLLSSIGITPRFNYHDGYNIIHLKLSRIRVNPAVALLLSGFIGIAGGAYLQLILTKEQLENLLILLHPVEEMFYRMLNAAAGPIIFLTVISAILSVGTLVSERKSGFRLIRRFLIMSSVITVVSLWILLFIPYFRIDNFEEQMRIKTFSDMMEMVFGIVPNDIITPFVNGDSPAIIFIALVTGNALLMAGSGSSLVVRVIEQADSVGLLLADWISSFSPWFITVLLVAGIGTNSVWEVLSVWKPLLAYTALSAVMLFAELLLVGGTVGMAPLRLWKKIRASFWIALLTGSVNEAYGANELCCREETGNPEETDGFRTSHRAGNLYARRDSGTADIHPACRRILSFDSDRRMVHTGGIHGSCPAGGGTAAARRGSSGLCGDVPHAGDSGRGPHRSRRGGYPVRLRDCRSGSGHASAGAGGGGTAGRRAE